MERGVLVCQGGQLHKEADLSQLLRGLLLAGYLSAKNNTQMSQQGKLSTEEFAHQGARFGPYLASVPVAG